MAHHETTQSGDAATGSATISTQDVGTAPVAVTTQCEEVIAQYRGGNLNRAESIDQLGSIISAAPGGIGGNPGALHAHLASLDDWDRERAAAATRGGEARGREQTRDPEGIGRDEGPTLPRGREIRNDPADISLFQGMLGPFVESRVPSPVEPARTTRWNEVNPADYAWNWRIVGMPVKWRSVNPLMRRTQLLRGVYARDPKQAIASLLDQYDKPNFPPSLWKTVLLHEFLELEKLYGETFTLEATKPDTYSLGPKVEIEIQESGGGAKSKAIKDFGIWATLWDQYAAAVIYAYPHRANELAAYRKWIVNYFMFSKSSNIVLDIDRAIRRAILADQTLSLDDEKSLAAFNFRFSDQGVGKAESSRSIQGSQRRGGARGISGDDVITVEYCKRWNRGQCNNLNCRFSHVCSGCGGDHQRASCQRIGGAGKARGM